MINAHYLSINDLGGRPSRAGMMNAVVGELYRVNGGWVAQSRPSDAGMGRYEGIDSDRRWMDG